MNKPSEIVEAVHRLMQDGSATMVDILKMADSLEPDLRQIAQSYGLGSQEANAAFQALATVLISIAYKQLEQVMQLNATKAGQLNTIGNTAYQAMYCLEYTRRLPLPDSFFTADINKMIEEIDGVARLYVNNQIAVNFCPMVQDDDYWEQSSAYGDYWAYIAKFPNGRHAYEANEKIKEAEEMAKRMKRDSDRRKARMAITCCTLVMLVPIAGALFYCSDQDYGLAHNIFMAGAIFAGLSVIACLYFNRGTGVGFKGALAFVALCLACVGGTRYSTYAENKMLEEERLEMLIEIENTYKQMATAEDFMYICSLTKDTVLLKQAADKFWAIVMAKADTMPLPVRYFTVGGKPMPSFVAEASLVNYCLPYGIRHPYKVKFEDFMYGLMQQADSIGTYTAWMRLRGSLPEYFEASILGETYPDDSSLLTPAESVFLEYSSNSSGMSSEINSRIDSIVAADWDTPEKAFKHVKAERSIEACELYLNKFLNIGEPSNTPHLTEVTDIMAQSIDDELHRLFPSAPDMTPRGSIIIMRNECQNANLTLTYTLPGSEDEPDGFTMKKGIAIHNSNYFVVPSLIEYDLTYPAHTFEITSKSKYSNTNSSSTYVTYDTTQITPLLYVEEMTLYNSLD